MIGKSQIFYSVTASNSECAISPLNGFEIRSRRQTGVQKCTPGATKMMDCNQCFCTDDGADWMCTLKACLRKRQAESHTKICTPGETKMMDCNHCFCADNGENWGCTLMGCSVPSAMDSLSRRKRQAIDNKMCTPGETKMMECNHCFCMPDGSDWACTEMACVKEPMVEMRSGTCQPGETKMEDCNQCRCANSGWACTKMACPMEPTCEPGTSFKNYCNTCRCHTDGLKKNAACTRLACDKDIWNQDGTIKNRPVEN